MLKIPSLNRSTEIATFSRCLFELTASRSGRTHVSIEKNNGEVGEFWLAHSGDCAAPCKKGGIQNIGTFKQMPTYVGSLLQSTNATRLAEGFVLLV